jgi:hypothetical protein
MTGTARPTDGETVFDKHSNKMTGTTGPTGGQTGGDKHPNKTTGTTETTDGRPVVPVVSLGCLSPPV